MLPMRPLFPAAAASRNLFHFNKSTLWSRNRLVSLNTQIRLKSTAIPTAAKTRRKYFTAAATLTALTATGGLYSIYALDNGYGQYGRVDFDIKRAFDTADPSTAFKHRSFGDLLRSAIIFELCQFPQIVDYTPSLLDAAKWLGLEKVAFWIIKQSFFKQFCGGETTDEVVPTMQLMQSTNGIRSILDLSVEADDSSSETTVDEKADRTAAMIKQCIETASMVQGSFAAVKVTALGSTTALRNLSHVLQYLRDLYRHHSTADGSVDCERFCNVLSQMPGYSANEYPKGKMEALFKQLNKDGSGSIDWIEFSDSINVSNPATRPLFFGPISNRDNNVQLTALSPAYNPQLTREQYDDYVKIEKRLCDLCSVAKAKGVSLMIDAEQSYFQPAIDSLALRQMQSFNAGADESTPLLYNTYQMYLVSGLERLQTDLKRAERQLATKDSQSSFVFAVKLVRGAYMTLERTRAQQLGIQDPIQPTVTDTHHAYDAAVELLVHHVSPLRNSSTADNNHKSKLSVACIVASHNRHSIIEACLRMQQLSVPNRGTIKFAQLYGMHDHLTYTLAQNGYEVCKYIPYGPVEDVIPYLLRRAQENRSVLTQSSDGGGTDDRSLLWRELRRRLRTFLLGDDNIRKTGGITEGLDSFVGKSDD